MALSRRGTNGFKILEYVIENGRSTGREMNKKLFGIGEDRPGHYSSTYSGLTREGILVNNGNGYEVTHYGLHVFNTLPYPNDQKKDEIKEGAFAVFNGRKIKEFGGLHLKVLEFISKTANVSDKAFIKVFGREVFEIELAELIVVGVVSFDKNFYTALKTVPQVREEYGVSVSDSEIKSTEVEKNPRMEELSSVIEEIKFCEEKIRYVRNELASIAVMGGRSSIPILEKIREEAKEQIKSFKEKYGHSTSASVQREIDGMVEKKGRSIGRRS